LRSQTIEQRLVNNSQWNGDCLEATRSTDPEGRPQLFWDEKVCKAARVMFALTRGYLPHYCCHTCDNRKCINPYHLYNGTPADNMRDMTNRRRGVNQLDNYTRHAIHVMLGWNISQTDIANELGIARTTVSKIKRGVIGW